MEIIVGLAILWFIGSLAINREESLPEERQLQETVAGVGYSGAIKVALVLFTVGVLGLLLMGGT